MTVHSRTFTIGSILIAFASLCCWIVGFVFCQATLRVSRAAPAKLSILQQQYPIAIWQDTAIRTNDHVQLRAWFARIKNNEAKCVIVLHGIADSRRGGVGFAALFLNQGYSVLLPDSRAHGQSGGEYVTYGLLEKYDVLQWAYWLQQAGCRKLYGLGESLGASILIQSAALKPVFRAIVAECAYSDLKLVAEDRVQQMLPLPVLISRFIAPLVVYDGMACAYLRYRFNFTQVSPVRSIQRAATPILLIHGLKDRKTPPYHSEVLAAANPHNQLWLVLNAGHTEAASVDPLEFQKRVLGWFSQH